MQPHGIRIFDSQDNVLNVNIFDVLKEIQNGDDLNWCILFLDGIPTLGEGNTATEYKNKINKSPEGFKTNWNEIFFVGNYFFQIFEIIILGSKAEEYLHRYDNDQEMYHFCDIVIELIDCAFWQIYSKDLELIDRLKKKFKNTEFLYY